MVVPWAAGSCLHAEGEAHTKQPGRMVRVVLFTQEALFSYRGVSLDDASLFQGYIRTVFAECLQSFRRCGEGNFLANFRYEHRLLLEVDVAAAFPGRIELCGAGAVRVPASDD